MSEGQKIIVLGVGPGHPQYLSVLGSELLWQAHVVAGFATVLKSAEPWIRGEQLVMDYKNQDEVLKVVAAGASEGKRCVVCAAGDSCVSAGELIERVRRKWNNVEVIPGISSTQVAAARAGITLEESLIVSLHQRAGIDTDVAELISELKRSRRHLIVLPRPWELMPDTVARKLLDGGIVPSTRVSVFQDLTLEQEKQQTISLGELANSSQTFSDRSILVFPKD